MIKMHCCINFKKTHVSQKEFKISHVALATPLNGVIYHLLAVKYLLCSVF